MGGGSQHAKSSLSPDLLGWQIVIISLLKQQHDKQSRQEVGLLAGEPFHLRRPPPPSTRTSTQCIGQSNRLRAETQRQGRMGEDSNPPSSPCSPDWLPAHKQYTHCHVAQTATFYPQTDHQALDILTSTGKADAQMRNCAPKGPATQPPPGFLTRLPHTPHRPSPLPHDLPCLVASQGMRHW